jgi:hypothetical protein
MVRDGKLIGISFQPQGSSAPVIVSGQGVTSVTRTGTGAFTVTLANQFRALVSAQTTMQLASPGGVAYQCVITGANVTGAGTGAQTVTLLVQNASTGAAADISENAGNIINLSLFVKSSGTSYPAGGVE